jgi:hypothetical protein
MIHLAQYRVCRNKTLCKIPYKFSADVSDNESEIANEKGMHFETGQFAVHQ